MEYSYKKLMADATRIRMDIIESVHNAGSGHPGGSLSIADILAVLYFKEMRLNVNNPQWPDRDRFVLSKGHAAPAYYSALAERGFFGVQELKNLRKSDSFLQGHPDMNKTPGVDMTTGSLGLGLSAANGMAIAGKMDNKDYRVYVILGDGELDEGQVWEAAMTATHYKLDNLMAFVDLNGLQLDGKVFNIMNSSNVCEKFASFGWNVISIDGHNITQIVEAIEKAKQSNDMPSVAVCNCVKGKGVSFMENEVSWHGMAPNKEQYEIAMNELRNIMKALED